MLELVYDKNSNTIGANEYFIVKNKLRVMQ